VRKNQDYLCSAKNNDAGCMDGLIGRTATRLPTRSTVVENLKGKSGWLILQRLIIDSFEREEHLLFSAFDDPGMTDPEPVREPGAVAIHLSQPYIGAWNAD
jgi:hypothetical protein